MSMKNLILLLVICPVVLFSQDTTEVTTQGVIEQILEDAADEHDVQQFGEELEYFQQHPINLAAPNYHELLKLPFISPLLAEAIILYADTVSITSLEQLLNVSLMTSDVYNKLLPFVTIERTNETMQAISSFFIPQSVESRTRYEQRIQPARGYTDGSFRGGPYSTYQRMRVNSNSIEAAGLFEKDAGEMFNNGLTAGYLSLKNISVVNQLVVGNYNISSGQGLVVARNIATSKGSNVIGQTRKRSSIISPSVSTDEFRYFQGIAGNIQAGNFSLAGFYSERMLPASINSERVATSFYTSGIYRTENDLRRQKVLKEKVAGGIVEYNFSTLQTITATAVRTEYDKYLKPTLLDLRGKKDIIAGSISWNWLFSSFSIFGEAASNDGMRYSKVLGVIIPVAKEFSISYHHRAFTKGYVSPFARPFGERATISDGETGNYFGSEIKLNKITFNSYVDYYSLPAAEQGFGTNAAEIYLQAMYSGIKNVNVMFHIRNKTKSQSAIRESDDWRTQTNYRAAYKFRINSALTIAQRFEVVNVSYAPSGYREKGFLSFVEGIFKKQNIAFNGKVRMVFFDTDSYDSRLYQYESDVAGNFSNPPLYGKGIRWYVVAGYEVFDNFQFSLKYSETKKLNEVVLGSGDDEIIGNLDNYIALQLDFKL